MPARRGSSADQLDLHRVAAISRCADTKWQIAVVRAKVRNLELGDLAVAYRLVRQGDALAYPGVHSA